MNFIHVLKAGCHYLYLNLSFYGFISYPQSLLKKLDCYLFFKLSIFFFLLKKSVVVGDRVNSLNVRVENGAFLGV